MYEVYASPTTKSASFNVNIKKNNKLHMIYYVRMHNICIFRSYRDSSVSQKTGPLQLISHNFHQFTTFTNYFWHRDTSFNAPLTTIKYTNIDDWLICKKFLNWLRTSCVVSITTVATWHIWTVDFWADFEQCIIGRAINKWQNESGAVSMPKDSIRTRVVTVDTAKHFTILHWNTV